MANHRNLTDAQEAEIIERYNNGESPADLVPAFNASRKAITNCLTRNNVKRRNRGGQAKPVVRPCSICGKIPPDVDFHFHQDGTRYSQCINCEHEQQRIYWQNGPKKHARKILRYKNEYGITPDEARELWILQDGLCPICGEQVEDPLLLRFGNNSKNDPSVDHCHITGKIRGILHNGCNMWLSGPLGKDNPSNHLNAIEYLMKSNPNWRRDVMLYFQEGSDSVLAQYGIRSASAAPGLPTGTPEAEGFGGA